MDNVKCKKKKNTEIKYNNNENNFLRGIAAKWLSQLPPKKVLGSNPNLRPFREQFVCVCVRFLQVLQFSPAVQRLSKFSLHTKKKIIFVI